MVSVDGASVNVESERQKEVILTSTFLRRQPSSPFKKVHVPGSFSTQSSAFSFAAGSLTPTATFFMYFCSPSSTYIFGFRNVRVETSVASMIGDMLHTWLTAVISQPIAGLDATTT